MTSKKILPDIRIKEYENNWSYSTLSEYGVTFTGLSGKTKEDFGRGDGFYIPYTNVFNNPIASIKHLESIGVDNTQNEVRYGDIFFTTSSETPKEVGMASVWKYDMKNVYLNSFCFGYRLTKNIDLNFLAHYLHSPNIRKQFQLLAQGISRFNISKKKAMEISMVIPSLEEQKKIGEFFINLSGIIKLKEKDLEKLYQFKQGMTHRMFPNKDHRVPDVRFRGFDDEWKEIKIAEIGQVVTGNTPSTTEQTYYSEEGTLWITPSDIKSNITKVSERRLSQQGLEVARVVPKGSILVTSIASIGKNTLVLEESGFNQQINAVVPKSKYDSYFLLVLSNFWSEQMKRTAAAGTMQIVNRTEFANILTIIPTLKEQQLIGKYFQTLDQNIGVKEQELDKLKQLKNAMLQKMFV